MRFDEALELLMKVQDIILDNSEALIALGTAYKNKEIYDKAAFYFEKGLTLNPKHPQA